VNGRSLVLAAVVAASLAISGGTRAEDGGAGAGADGSRRATVVARVGEGANTREITVGELEDRLAAMPPFQRAMYGATPDAVRRAFLTDVLLRGALLDLAAGAARVASDPAVEYALDRTRSNATLRALRAAAPPASGIPASEVQAYYDENRARYDAPERIQVWRILCATRADADSVLAAAAATPTPKQFVELAREHSKDKATYLRGGNLGFLTADGVSNEPGLQVDPAIVRAAQGVRDGELVHAPVAEGAYFAVVWRRGTIAASQQSPKQVAPQIRDALSKLRVRKDADDLVLRLRAAAVHDEHADLLDLVDVAPLPPATPKPSR
jgi:peptidyl-prolyl cis-trans isomerase C